jgi:hypothetical protein
MLCEQQQRLLATHAATDGVDLAQIEAEPRLRLLDDHRHAGKVGDLAAPPPRVNRKPSSHPARADDGEATASRQVTPPLRVRDRSDPAPMWRDHES